MSAAAREREPRIVRWLSPPLFAAAILCFLLPFVSVSCSGQGEPIEAATSRGVDLVTGGDPRLNPDLVRAFGEEGFAPDLGPQPFAIAAVAAALAGLALALTPRRWARLAAGVAAIGGVASLLLLRSRVESQVAAQSGSDLPGLGFIVRYEIGYWLALGFLAAATAVQGVRIILAARGLRRARGSPARRSVSSGEVEVERRRP